MKRQGHLARAKPWVSYELSRPPAESVVRRVARAQGYELRRGRKGAECYWLVDRSKQVVTPRLRLVGVWTALVLPRADERVDGLWLD